jgi:hypothetical protein
MRAHRETRAPRVLAKARLAHDRRARQGRGVGPDF